MSGWTAKRFWKAASVAALDSGYGVQLDARVVKTPAKAALTLPTEAMALAIAAEWDAQEGVIKPETMPLTRAANSAIDKIGVMFEAVVDEIAGFGGSDLLCYRAPAPQALAERQATAWDPMLAWAEHRYGAPLRVTSGVIPVAQPEASLARLREAVAGYSAFELAALHDLVAISGSLVIGLAVAEHHLEADAAFAMSRIDEAWQDEQWGQDEEAAAAEVKRLEAFRSAARFFELCGSQSGLTYGQLAR